MRYRGTVMGGYRTLARAVLDKAVEDNDTAFLGSRQAELYEAVLEEPYVPSNAAPEISRLCAEMHAGAMAWEYR